VTIELTSGNFQQEVLQADVPVLVDFWGPGCAPCRQLAPLIDALAASAGGKYRVGKVNIAEEASLASRYRISGIPTLLLFKGGQVVQKWAGVTPERTLTRALHDAA
jgi:thioredoxin 1